MEIPVGLIDDACDLQSLNVKDLKKYLSSRGQHVSGNKRQLLERAQGARRLCLSDISIDRKDNIQEQENRKNDKLCTPLNERLPHPSELKNWTENFSNIPDFTEKEIYNYVVLKMNHKKQLKSKVFYEDGHVHSVKMSDVDENSSHCYVKANVLPSLPTANKKDTPDYSTWVMLSKVSGCVYSAECNCTAGEGEACNHISALLYAVADISKKKSEGKLAPTAQKCKWNNPRKRKLSPKKAEQVQFKKHSFEKSSEGTNVQVKLYDSKNSTCTANVQRFKERLLQNQSTSNAGWLANFMKVDSDSLVDVPMLHSISYQFRDCVDIRSHYIQGTFQSYFDNLCVTEDECLLIEQCTRKQSESSLWKKARQDRITASNFGYVMKRKSFDNPEGLVNKLFDYTFQDSEYTRYGRTHEKPARKTYVRYMKKTHPGIQVKECGLLVKPTYPFLGASPDGLVYCTCKMCHSMGHGLLEIKCPASQKWRMLSPEDCARDKDFYCSLNDNGDIVLKRNHVYYYQVQGQMAISGHKWCDFVIWTCKGKVAVERIMFDESLWSIMLRKLALCYVEVFIPELFTERVKRGKKLFG